MSLIDWSDPDEMLGLLVEYVADEAVASEDDSGRANFLDHLTLELTAAAERDFQSVEQMVATLRDIQESQPREFAHDSVMSHVAACIDELDRIRHHRAHNAD